jgi:hypothetical protein
MPNVHVPYPFYLCIDDVNRYKLALEEQPVHPLLQTEVAKFAAVILFATGNILVLSSMWALGVTGTYLGKVDFGFALGGAQCVRPLTRFCR